jgi:hypothetical protein
LAIGLLLALVPAVLAGGWAVITLDEMPGEVRAGEPWTVGFTVLQHGQTPVHILDDGTPIEARLIATNPATGERVNVIAEPTGESGHFTVEITFPSEGEWTWTISPAPLVGETQFEPLTVLPASLVVPDNSKASVAPEAAPSSIDEPVNASAPVAPATHAPEARNGLSIPVVLRWGAIIVAFLALALFVVQNRRKIRPVEAES